MVCTSTTDLQRFGFVLNQFAAELSHLEKGPFIVNICCNETNLLEIEGNIFDLLAEIHTIELRQVVKAELQNMYKITGEGEVMESDQDSHTGNLR